MLRKTIAYVVVLALLAAGSWYAYSHYFAAPKPAGAGGVPPNFAMPVEAQAVRVDTVIRAIRAVGTLRSTETVMISADIAGKVAQILVVEGQRVSRGTPIATLDSAVAQAELAQAKVKLLLSQQTYNRAAELLNRGVGTAKTVEESTANLRSDEANVALAQARLDKPRIVAPFDGILGLRQVSVGKFLSPGDPIVNLEQIDPIKVDFRVPEVNLTSVSVGQRLEIELDALPGQRFAGEVYAIDPAIDVAGRSIVVRARLPNPDLTLRPGLFARVSLIVSRTENAILVPERALFAFGDDQFVYVVADGKAVQTKVKLGTRQNADVQVVEGLKAGDVVIVDGQIKVRPGSPVQPVGQAPTAPKQG